MFIVFSVKTIRLLKNSKKTKEKVVKTCGEPMAQIALILSKKIKLPKELIRTGPLYHDILQCNVFYMAAESLLFTLNSKRTL